MGSPSHSGNHKRRTGLPVDRFLFLPDILAPMPPLRPFALEVFLGKWEFTARYHLCASDMQSMTLSELLEMADPTDRAAWDELYLGYTETWGAPALREIIASTYDTLSARNMLTFVGAQEGIFAAMHALLGPDDHAITVIPNYQSVES